MKIEVLCYVEDGILTVALRGEKNVFENAFKDDDLFVEYNEVMPGNGFNKYGLTIDSTNNGWVVNGEEMSINGHGGLNFEI